MYRRFALVLSLALSISSVAAGARADAFIKIDSIPGSSIDKTFPDQLAVDSFSFGASTSATLNGAGANSGRVQFDELTFSHQVDRASAQLLLAVSLAKVIKTVVLTVRKPGAPDGYLKVTFSNVLVTAVKVGGSGNDPTREDVTLRFSKILFDHLVQQSDGKMASSGKPAGWDLTSMKVLTE